MSELCGLSEEEKVGGEEMSKTIICHLQKHQEEVRACLGGDDRYCFLKFFFLLTLQKIQQSQMFKILQ